ncbi:glycosyltransferase [Butyrivibrio sp. XPD2002]|uniref:glycosyltransferase n=1 Tax=Butyrivibrio sp. XPD2002 TaxID=1280665 RepID=UPI0003F98756|nr:glycosyltransferase [Butyrivibrio sp. XPD2002]
MCAPLVSVVVPTYKRYKYLIDCIDTLLSIRENDIEFVIQDNTEDNSEVLQHISSISDPRFHYFHEPKHISVMENSDLAVSHSSGKYVCMIGDDDTVSSRILKVAEFCEANKIDSCSFIFPGFNWPDMTFEAKKREANLFFLKKATGTVKLLNIEEILAQALKVGSAPSPEMPRLYHGLVGRECLDRIYKKTGTYFPGPSPDAANSVPVCLETQKPAMFFDYAIISGYGKGSARGEGNRGQHYGELKDKPWLPKDILERWNDDLPPIFSAETILAQSMLEALNAMGRKDLIKRFGFDRVYGVFLLHHKDATCRMLRFCLKKPRRLFLLARGIIKRYYDRKVYLANPKGNSNYKEYEGVKTLAEAQQITEELSSRITSYHFVSNKSNS